jgi:hypothetical protein
MRLDVLASSDDETDRLEEVRLDDRVRPRLLESGSQWLQIYDLPSVRVAESHCFDLL